MVMDPVWPQEGIHTVGGIRVSRQTDLLCWTWVAVNQVLVHQQQGLSRQATALDDAAGVSWLVKVLEVVAAYMTGLLACMEEEDDSLADEQPAG